MHGIGETTALHDAFFRSGRIVTRPDLSRRYVELAQPNGRIRGIERHAAIVQEETGKAKPENRTVIQSNVLIPGT